jgi:hypothetical protein
MQLELLSITLSAVSLVTVLTGLRQTGSPFLRRMAACFTATFFPALIGIFLERTGTSTMTELANLLFSFLATYVLIMGGIDVVEAKNKNAKIKKIIINSFPGGLICYVALYLLNFGLGQPNLGERMLNAAELFDSASSISACAFVALALCVRLLINEEYVLGLATTCSFALWAVPESVYWQGGTLASQLAMGLGGVLVAFTVTVAARRRAI